MNDTFNHKDYENNIKSICEHFNLINIDNLYDSIETTTKNVLLIHDVDADLTATKDISDIDISYGIRSIYMIRVSGIYNILCKRARKILSYLSDKHDIGLHFDCSVHKIPELGINEECLILNSIVNTTSCINFHKHALYRQDAYIYGMKNLHSNEVKSNMEYISDSRGSFRYGTISDYIGKDVNLLINIHPEWYGNNSIKSTFDKIIDNRINDIVDDLNVFRCVTDEF